jgi:hypothetical protein
MELFSPAQCVGYIALILGVAAFLQKTDHRLKFLVASESLVYAVHFMLLGNFSASGSALVSCVRSFLALKYRSPWLAALIIGINVAIGVVLAKSGAGWLPVIASCAATIALFTMQGIRLRLVLLTCTLLWLANNIISRSVGGTLLETIIAITNISTILRMLRLLAKESLVRAEEEETCRV